MARDDPKTAEEIFDCVVAYKRQHDGLTPSVRQIAERVTVSRSTVRYHLLKLQGAGRLHLTRRGIEIAGGEWTLRDQGV